MRTWLLVPAMLLASCAAQKLAVPPSDAYGAAIDVTPSEDEVDLLDALDAGLARAGLPAATRDPALIAAARAHCNAHLASSKEQPGALEMARELLAEGVADAEYEFIDVPGSWSKHSLKPEEVDGLVKKLGKTSAPLRAGACAAADGMASSRYFALVVTEHRADLSAPRVVAPGQEAQVSAKVGEGVGDPALYVGGPDGKADRHPDLSATVGGAPGLYVVEVVGTIDGRRHVLSRAAITVGEQPAEFPATPGEEAAPIRTADDARAALEKVLEKAHGGPVPKDAAVEGAAQAEAEAQVAEEPAGAVTPPAGAEVWSQRVPGGELQLTLGMLEMSPYVRSAAQHTVTPAAARAKGGDVGLSLVIGGAAQPAPAMELPATPPPQKVDPAVEEGEAAAEPGTTAP